MANKKTLAAAYLSALTLGVAAVSPVALASTYDPATNTINAALVNDAGSGADGTYGFWGNSGADFIGDTADIATNGLNITGSIDDIRGTLEYLYTYISSGLAGAAGLQTALAGVDDITLNITGDTELTPNDLGYIQFLEKYVKSSTNATATVAVNVDGDVTFGAGTGYYLNDSVADITANGGPVDLSATGTITIPDGFGADITDFLGTAVIKAGNTVVSDGVTYTVTTDNVFTQEKSPETGFEKNLVITSILPAAAVVALLGAAYVVAKRVRR
ncbi:MAG: hypothetical protein LBL84_02595 [Candidatus Nomurabacteria bacterium]|jgi:hypothetical protein|nr:hypothetical protein [Candidatus Nomurabacteria bacterium]